MSDNLDPVEFGRLIQSVDNLTITVNEIKTDVASLKETRDRGWGILAGITLVAGGLGASAHTLFERLFK